MNILKIKRTQPLFKTWNLLEVTEMIGEDTVSYDKFLVKLSNFVIRGNAHHLLRSYLFNRTQYTQFLKKIYPTIFQSCLVFHKALYSVLFLIYVKKVNFYCTLTTLTSLSRVIPWGCIWKSQPPHRSGSKLHVRSNLLHVNLSKCNFMYFGYFPESKILTNNSIMPSPSPTWFTDHLTYCISVWGGQSFSTNYSLYKLFIIQKHCVKMLLFFYCKRKSTQSMVSLYFFGTLRPFFNW